MLGNSDNVNKNYDTGLKVNENTIIMPQIKTQYLNCEGNNSKKKYFNLKLSNITVKPQTILFCKSKKSKRRQIIMIIIWKKQLAI